MNRNYAQPRGTGVGPDSVLQLTWKSKSCSSTEGSTLHPGSAGKFLKAGEEQSGMVCFFIVHAR